MRIPILVKRHLYIESATWGRIYARHLRHWGGSNMVAIFQTFSCAFSWMKIQKFRLRFHWRFFPKRPINNIPEMVQIMTWRRTRDKPLSEPMMVSLLTHICVTLSHWVNWLSIRQLFINLANVDLWSSVTSEITFSEISIKLKFLVFKPQISVSSGCSSNFIPNRKQWMAYMSKDTTSVN